MAQITAALVKAVRQRTGAGISDCKKALEASGGDVEKAIQQLMLDRPANAWPSGHFEVELASFKNQLLVAMPGLEDDNFSQTVSLLCEHNDKGAIGLVLNRPTELSLNDMLDQMGITHEPVSGASNTVYWGGPVQPERGFVVHRGPGGWESSMQVSEDLYITTSRDILAAVGRGEGPREFIVALGYAGWGAGQLEEEVMQNSWLNTPVDSAILFRTPAPQRWKAATRLLGIDVIQLSGFSGHA